ncbi:actin family [Polychytrium aggregatum]|uniref:actin family n=1 Tax=Polychytrium aggregatum TaxID=110093 RepID=UPI0022FE8DB3|nr:actin family [Polychytrium aggregatum]KAI9197307.1 actin family [Polychytrium aggregatum]
MSGSTTSLLRRHSMYGTEDRIVLDLGSRYLKCGFSGESKPRHVLPVAIPVFSQDGSRSGKKMVTLFQLESDPAVLESIRNVLSDLFYQTFHQYLLTDPKQRSVIICENLLMPIAIKKLICDVLFNELEVPSISFVPSHVLALLACGKTTGLVVDIGHLELSVLPIYDGRPLLRQMKTLPIAGHSVTTRLKLLLKNHGKVLQDGVDMVPIEDSFVEKLSNEFYENLKAQVCFVGAFPTFEDVSFENREAAFPYREKLYEYTVYKSETRPVHVTVDSNDKLWVPGWVRERSAEVLFEGDDDGVSVANVILEAIIQCPRDIRMDLYRNVLLIGGTSMLPGFHQRLQEHIYRLLEESPRYNWNRRSQANWSIIKTIFKANCLAWTGGSLMGVMKWTGRGELKRENYERNGEIPDWSCLSTEE